MLIEGAKTLADMFGVVPKTINDWQNDGMPIHERGAGSVPNKYIAADCIAWRIARDQVAADGQSYDLTAERARLAHHQANIASLDEEVKRKSLIPAETVKSKWGDLVASFRAKMLSLPTKIAGTCVGLSDIEVEAAARGIVYQALDELSRGNGVD